MSDDDERAPQITLDLRITDGEHTTEVRQTVPRSDVELSAIGPRRSLEVRLGDAFRYALSDFVRKAFGNGGE